MFSPSRDEARRLFFGAWEKYLAKRPLEGLEGIALEVILAHPEYHAILSPIPNATPRATTGRRTARQTLSCT